MPDFQWLRYLGACCALALSATVWANHSSNTENPRIVSVRAWHAGPEADDAQSARLALAAALPIAARNDAFEFNVPAGQPVWYALELANVPNALATVLELAHPSIRTADLYLPASLASAAGGTQDLAASLLPPQHAGRDLPPVLRAEQNFASSFLLPAFSGSHTVYVRVSGSVNMRGQFVWQQQSTWQATVASYQRTMFWCFAVAVGAALLALLLFYRSGSPAYAWYAGTTASIALVGVLVTGVGESSTWSALSPIRAVLSSAMACIAAGLALMLARSAFGLALKAPRLSSVLLVVGLLAMASSTLGLVLDIQHFQLLSHTLAATACVLSMLSFVLAWRAGDTAVALILIGYLPVVLGVVLTILAMSGSMAFAPWVLLAMPVAGLLDVPINMWGLHLLAKRRQLVRRSLASAAPGGFDESRNSIAVRMQGRSRTATTLMLVRFPALAPGSAALRRLDEVALAQYFQAMIKASVDSGAKVARWSFHELVMQHNWPVSSSALRSLKSALFAQALRCEDYGLKEADARLRMAVGEYDYAVMPLPDAIERLATALDNPSHTKMRIVEFDLEYRQVLNDLAQHSGASAPQSSGSPVSRP
jgi:hypothetical protein